MCAVSASLNVVVVERGDLLVGLCGGAADGDGGQEGELLNPVWKWGVGWAGCCMGVKMCVVCGGDVSVCGVGACCLGVRG